MRLAKVNEEPTVPATAMVMFERTKLADDERVSALQDLVFC